MDWSTTQANVLLDAVDDAIVVVDSEFRIRYLNAAGRTRLGVSVQADPEQLQGVNPAAWIHPDDIAPILAVFDEVQASPSNRRVTRMRIPSGGVVPGEWRTVELTATNRLDDPDIAGVVVCFREVYREEAAAAALNAERQLRSDVVKLRAQVEERQAFLHRIVGIQDLIARRAPLHEVFQSVVDAARDSLRCSSACLSLVAPEHPGQVVLTAWSGLPEASVTEFWGSPVLPPCGPVAELTKAGDLEVCAQTRQLFGPRLRRGLIAPIRSDGAVVGVITVASITPWPDFDDGDRTALESLADHAALALMDARSQEQMLRQALIDPLTGLANRALVLDRIERSLDRSRRTGMSTAVLFIDLDRFKAINDGNGHDVGDKVLVEVARRVESVLHAGDTLARLGGDEFVAVLGDADELVAAAIAQRISATVRRPIGLDGQVYYLDCSIGIAMSGAGPCLASGLISDADIAMYRAKAAGGASVEFFADSMKSEVVKRASMEGDLRSALHDGLIDVMFQPVVSFETMGIYAVEALARWTTSDRGAVPPSEFIPLAEDAGLVTELDRHILRRSCTLMRDVTDPETGEPVVLKVNLSPRHLATPDVVDAVWSILVDTDFPASRLVLELTETELMQDTERTIVVLKALRELGLKLAVDDFGTGYSSLAYLQQFPINIMKVDRTFVAEAVNDDRCLRLTQAMIEVARALHLEVVAEGIETVEHARLLRSLGAQYGQGYLFARPVQVSELAATFALARMRARQALGASAPDAGELVETLSALV